MRNTWRSMIPLPLLDGDGGGGAGGGTGADGGAGAGAGAGKTFTQAELDGIINERLARERDKYKDYDSIKTEYEKLKQGQMTEAEKLNAKIKELETKSAEAESKVKAAQLKELREAALTKLGLPTSWASRIGGEDAKSIEDDAKELQKLLGGNKIGGGSTPPSGSNSENAAMNDFIRQGAGRM